ncbi:hypothetical protein G6F45_014142 [Rhizopus arrhizus]|nr:hypothetical protein G6F45_014142 [Rhizopus arrhizus]
MLWASIHAMTTASTRRTPGVSGNLASTHAISTNVNPDMIQNAARQPTADPSKVPSGTPRDKAMGVPTMASAIAWPCW